MMRGDRVSDEVGHAWVCDGCRYALDSSGRLLDGYLHVNWGWDGSSNGYFSCAPFDFANESDYYPTNYFSINVYNP